MARARPEGEADVIDLLEAAGSRWAALVWPLLWQGSLVSLMALACLPLIRRVSPALGLILVAVALLKFVIPPVVLAPMAFLDQAAKSFRPDGPLDDQSLAAAVLLIVHVIGVVVAGRQLHGRRRDLADLVAASRPVPDESLGVLRATAQSLRIARVPQLRESLSVAAPLAVGVSTPTILLPAGLRDSLTPDLLRVVIAHELVHHRSRDLVGEALVSAVCALWWFHPLVWVMASRFRELREERCDDRVIALGIDPHTYCRALLDIAAAHRPSPAVAMRSTAHPLRRRFERLLARRRRRRPLMIAATLGVALFATTALPNTLSPRQRAGHRQFHQLNRAARDLRPDRDANRQPALKSVPSAESRSTVAMASCQENRQMSFYHLRLLLLSSSFASTPVLAQAPVIKWEPFELTMAGNTKEAAEVGRITVPARRDRSTAATIELAFVRLRSAADKPASPLIYLDGGPGGGGYTAASIAEYADLFNRIRATRDVILLSQRGTGLSRPRPACGPEGPLPDDFFASTDTMTRNLLDRARRCAEQLRQKGLDPGAYNTQESADDVEDLRKALGVDRVVLFGFSYGTHLGLSVLRRWPSSVERAVLAGTEGPGHTWKFARTMDAQLAKLSDAAGGEVVSAWRRLIETAGKAPLQVVVRADAASRTLSIGAAGLQYLLRRDVGDTNDWPALPAAIIQASRGDFALLGRLAARRHAGLSSGISLMPLATDCASGASARRLAAIAEQEPSPLFGMMTNYPYPAACAALDLPMLPDAFRAEVRSSVPTLFISGALDSNTPPAQAEEVAAGFTSPVHLIVENAGHESTLVDEVRTAIVRFLNGEPVKSGTVAAPPIIFRPMDGADWF